MMCYSCGMAGNSEYDNKADWRLSSDQRLARGIVEWSKRFVTRDSHRIEYVQAAETAGIIAKCAGISFKYGRPEDGYRSLSFAQDLQHNAAMFALSPAAKRGQPFIDGPKKSRRDQLAKLMHDAMAALPPKATAKQVFAKCEDLGLGHVILEIDRDDPEAPVIHWLDRGREKTTTFKSFQNRLTGYRKKIHGT